MTPVAEAVLLLFEAVASHTAEIEKLLDTIRGVHSGAIDPATILAKPDELHSDFAKDNAAADASVDAKFGK